MSVSISSPGTWPLGDPRTLRPGQRAEVWIADLTGSARRIYRTDSVLLEAPNWAPDGGGLLLNGGGVLWRLNLDPVRLALVDIDGLPPINNDHVPDPSSDSVYLSANDGHLYRAVEHFPGWPASRRGAAFWTSAAAPVHGPWRWRTPTAP